MMHIHMIILFKLKPAHLTYQACRAGPLLFLLVGMDKSYLPRPNSIPKLILKV